MSDTVHHHGGGVERGLGLPVRLCPGNRREVVHELCGHLYFLLYDVVRVVIFNGSDGKHGLVLAAVDSSAPRQKLFDYLFGKGRTVMDSGAETDSVISFFRYFRIPVSWHASFTYIFFGKCRFLRQAEDIPLGFYPDEFSPRGSYPNSPVDNQESPDTVRV